jgi:hypothetical protein
VSNGGLVVMQHQDKNLDHLTVAARLLEQDDF